jgi:hypothetical protein
MNDSPAAASRGSHRSLSLSHGSVIHTSASSLQRATGRLVRVDKRTLLLPPPRTPLAVKSPPTAVQCRHGRRHLLLLLLLDTGHFNLPARTGQCAEVTAATRTGQRTAQAQQLLALLALVPLAALNLQAAFVARVRLCLLGTLAQLYTLWHRSVPVAGDRRPSVRVLYACRGCRFAGRAFLRRARGRHVCGFAPSFVRKTQKEASFCKLSGTSHTVLKLVHMVEGCV